VKRISRHLAQHVVLFAALAEVPVRNARQRVRPLQRDVEHHHQLIRIRIRKRSQQHCIHNAENRGVGSDAQGEREHRHRREAGRLPHHQHAVQEVLGEILNPVHPPGLAALLLNPVHRSKFPQSHGPGFPLRHTRGDCLFGQLLDMNLDLPLQFRIGTGTMQQSMNTPLDDPANPHKSPASRALDEELDPGRKPVPAPEFPLQLFPAVSGERVNLRGPSEIRLLPFRADPALILQPVQRRVQRPLSH
jgi:hypothetical protein